ncbi:MAG: hypothetical protein LIO58_04485 [Oscillospiraceae bacterium]|nr:hypothetical protein [Oscillospiraceae bacterium]
MRLTAAPVRLMHSPSLSYFGEKEIIVLTIIIICLNIDIFVELSSRQTKILEETAMPDYVLALDQGTTGSRCML